MAEWLSESIKWYGVLVLAAWVAAPVTRWVCHRLPDRGASIARPVGLLIVIWPTWWLAGVSPLPFSTAGLWVTLFGLGVVGWFLAWRAGWIERTWLVQLCTVEIVALAIFAVYVGLRGYTPEIIWTEKPMDMAFLTSSMRTTEVPPADPWFAGEPINYYYLGYFVHASIGRLSSVPSWVGYNLALATTASMVGVAAAGLAWNITRTWLGKRAAAASAVLAGFFLLLSGNLLASRELIAAPGAAFRDSWWGRIGWSSSRIVVDNGSSQAETINEFPWFSLLLGDLHPHVTALPFTVMALVLSYTILGSPSAVDWNKAQWMRLVLIGGLIGALYPLNSLDLPTYLLIAAGALLLACGLTRQFVTGTAVVFGTALLAWLPFTVRFVPFAGGDRDDLPDWLQNIPGLSRLATTLSVFTGEHTSVEEFLTVFGLFWFTLVVAIAVAAHRQIGRSGMPRMPLPVVLLVGAIILVALALPAPVVVMAGLPLMVAIWLMRGYDRQGFVSAQALSGLAIVALVLLLGTEFLYVQDSFDGRYNTLFKVYYQIWTILSIGCAVALVWMWRLTRSHAGWRVLLSVSTVLLLLAAAAYPITATAQWTRVHGSRDWQGLDGIAFFADYSADDLAAIRWLADNAEPDDRLLEAPGCSYQVNGAIPTGRLATFTGVPNVIGWDFHEVQWRGGQPELLAEIEPRAVDVAAMYADAASPLFDDYGITLLFVGEYERNGAGDVCAKAGPFPLASSPDFPGPGWTEIFRSGESTIYRREVS